MRGRSQDELSDTEETQEDLDKLRDNEDTDWTRIRPFGAGLKRKRVQFVKATDASNASEQPSSATPRRTTSSSDISDLYLSLVMPSGGKSSSTSSTSGSTSSASEPAAPSLCSGSLLLPPLPQAEAHRADETITQSDDAEDHSTQYDSSEKVVNETNHGIYCSTCNTQITTDMKTHARSIVHMYNEGHSDVPHHFNRNSEGFKHMVGLGWNPDERQGLGPDGSGIRYPVRVSEKNDKLGIGAKRIRNSTSPFSSAASKKDVHVGHKTKPISVKDLRRLEIIEREKKRSLHEYLSR